MCLFNACGFLTNCGTLSIYVIFFFFFFLFLHKYWLIIGTYKLRVFILGLVNKQDQNINKIFLSKRLLALELFIIGIWVSILFLPDKI